MDNLSKEFWSKENLPNDLFILLEKLSKGYSLNIKDLYTKYKSCNQKNKKKLIGNKKETLIKNNLKRIENKNLKNDKVRLENYKKLDTLDFESWLSYFESPMGRNLLKLESIKKLDKKKDKLTKIELLLQLNSDDFDKSDDKKFVKQQKKIINKLNLKRIQLKCLGNRLPPLDFYNEREFNLEDWQVKSIDCILKGESLLICAPTSSGKTMITTYFSEINKKILYIVPSKPLALQVAALFYKIVNQHLSIYVDDFTYTAVNPKIVIGTPYEIETKLIDNDFDLIVYDEIHNLNYENGDCYERLIKLYNCNFIALSATIANADQLITWWKSIHSNLKINKIHYENRFINTQRSYWCDKQKTINKIHPLSLIDSDIFTCTNGKNKINLPFTPWDSYTVWDSFKDSDENIYNKLDPEKYFENTDRITLNDSKKYEDQIKKELFDMNSSIRNQLLEKYYIEQQEIKPEFDILALMLNLKKKKLNPSIIFNQDSLTCMEMFKKLINLLEDDESFNYPFHYENLEMKDKLYREYKRKRNDTEKNLKLEEKFNILKKYDEKELEIYISKISENYKKQVDKLKKEDKKLQIKNLTQNYKKDIDIKCIEEVDVFEKHSDYSFNKEPMKRDKIKRLKQIITEKLGIKIDYTNFLIQGLKRGIGIYTKSLPEVYLRIVQELAQNKELGLVFSDESLALGINMPFKSVIIVGWNNSTILDKLLYHQMIGRAGRRGLDSEGNVVYVNIDWKSLIKMKMSSIAGKISHISNYDIIEKMDTNLCYDDLNKNYLYNYVNNITENDISKTICKVTENDFTYLLIMWKLRKIDRINLIVDYINYLELHFSQTEINNIIINKVLENTIKILYLPKKNDLEEYINGDLTDNLSINLSKTLVNKNTSLSLCSNSKNYLINNLTLLGDLFKTIYNTIVHSVINEKIKMIFLKCFHICKNLLVKFLELN